MCVCVTHEQLLTTPEQQKALSGRFSPISFIVLAWTLFPTGASCYPTFSLDQPFSTHWLLSLFAATGSKRNKHAHNWSQDNIATQNFFHRLPALFSPVSQDVNTFRVFTAGGACAKKSVNPNLLLSTSCSGKTLAQS